MRGVKAIEVFIAAVVLLGFAVTAVLTERPAPRKYPEAYDVWVARK